MKNPIEPSDMFATPDSMDSLIANMEQYRESERAAFTMGMMLTWNFLSAEIDRALEDERTQDTNGE